MSSSFSSSIGATQLTRMLDLSRRLNSMSSVDELLTLIIREAADLIGSESASIMLLDPYTRELRFKAISGEMPPELDNVLIPLDQSIAGQILSTNEPLIVNNVEDNPSWNPDVDTAIDFKTSGILGVPMHDASSEAIGVLEALNKLDGNPFSEDDIAVLSTLADLAGAAIGKARLFDELQKTYRKLNELDQLKSDFIALASHELRTPLSIILGYVSFLREEADEDTAAQLDHVLRAAVRLRSLIQDMLNLRYVDAGQTALNMTTFDLVKLIRFVVGDRSQTSLAKNQTMKLHTPPGPLMIHADRDMIEVTMNNLVGNAMKFTGDGGRIDVGVAPRGNEAWLYVRDTGVGIPADQLERVFDRFYQVEPHINRTYEGMGIGLSIAQELVNLHNGRIWVQSEDGQGCEFFVALPLESAAP
ncbi:MAG: GAF domain-containing sensor histidine kinase [Anaerolineales bacterium]|nr:GAF domain-containing sensor histidine kinase [Anaerolineales bacterium]